MTNNPEVKPWIKATSTGKLYIDTTHPEWQASFAARVILLSEKSLNMTHLDARTKDIIDRRFWDMI